MQTSDPIHNIELMVKDIHDRGGKLTQPVRRRYPFLFALLLTISGAAIFQGFELVVEQTPALQSHPVGLIVGGMLLLLFTGGLYRVLDKPK